MLTVACGSEQGATAAPFTCSIGSLSGTWRVTYRETNGTCGPVADELLVEPDADAASPDAGADPCTYAARRIAADRCRYDFDFTCPLNGVKGTQRWVGTLRQTSATTLEGPWTLQGIAPDAACRSSYDVIWSQE